MEKPLYGPRKKYRRYEKYFAFLLLSLGIGGLCIAIFEIDFGSGSLPLYLILFALLGLAYFSGFQDGWLSREWEQYFENRRPEEP